MGVGYNPKIVTDGLVFCVDPANPKCYSSGSTCKDLTLKNGIGTLTDVTLSADKGFLMSVEDTSKVKFTRGFTNITNNITYSVVIEGKTENMPPGTSPIFLSSLTPDGNGIGLFCSNDGISNMIINFYLVSDNLFDALVVEYLLPLNLWTGKYIITGTISSSRANLYLNGTLVSSSINPSYAFNNQNYIHIGANDQYVIYTYPGIKIYQSMIYNRALTAAEVLQNYNALKGKYKI